MTNPVPRFPQWRCRADAKVTVIITLLLADYTEGIKKEAADKGYPCLRPFAFASRRYAVSLLLFRSAVYQLHELVELWSDDDLCAAVALLVDICGVCHERIVFATATGSETLRIYAVLCLEHLHYA